MELHSVIRNIINTYGVDVLKDTRLVSMLADYQVFDMCPSAKYMLRSIINDGYGAKLLSCGSWNARAVSLLSQYSEMTGFQTNVLTYVFRCLSYGLNWTSEVPVFDPSYVEVKSDKIEYTKEEMEDSLLEKVQYNPLLSSKYGLNTPNCYFTMDSETRISISLEISGELKNAKALGIYFAIYDKRNRVRYSSILQCLDSSYEGFKVSMSMFEIGISVQEITKITIYPEKLD